MSDTVCPACAARNSPGRSACRICGGPLTEIPPPAFADALPVGTELLGGEYRVGETLRRDEFGFVCVASQERLQRFLILKEFFPAGSRREGSEVRAGGATSEPDLTAIRERVLEAAGVLSEIDAPGIVAVYEGFVQNGTAYVAMEYLPGKSLARRMKERNSPLPEEEAVEAAKTVGEALAALHEKGLAHGGVRADRILLAEDGRIVLSDFVSLRALANGPERVDPRDDLYDLGATLHHLLTGAPPPTPKEREAGAEVPPVRALHPQISEATERAVSAALQPDPARRPETVSEWLARLNTSPEPPSNAPKKRRFSPLAGLSVALIAVLIVFLSGHSRGSLQYARSALRRIAQTARISTLNATVERANPKDQAEMVFVPAGTFTMGDSSGDSDERPAHKVYLDGFWIYKTPVTVAQYRKFCEVTHREMPDEPNWGWQDDHPIVGVTWNDATAYAKWAGVRLPTEAEWEKAARGTDGRKYPWGNRWDSSRLQCSKGDWGDSGGTASVGAHPEGASPYGVLDMAGNVWEWMADWYEVGYYANAPKRDPKGPPTGTKRVLRSGSWRGFSPSIFRVVSRGANRPDKGLVIYGFRCAAAP
jgi:serine/threonine-protein kinase